MQDAAGATACPSYPPRAPPPTLDVDAVAWRQRWNASTPRTARYSGGRTLPRTSPDRGKLARYAVGSDALRPLVQPHAHHNHLSRRLPLTWMRLHGASAGTRAHRVQLATQAAVHCPGRAQTEASSPAMRWARMRCVRLCNRMPIIST